MANLEQMAALSKPFTTANGVTYQLPPLNLVTRRKAVAYIAKAQAIQESGLSEMDQVEKLFDDLVDLLMLWLGRLMPDISKEQIEEDFDIADVPELMAIINGMERELQSLVPPASSAPNRAQRRARK